MKGHGDWMVPIVLPSDLRLGEVVGGLNDDILCFLSSGMNQGKEVFFQQQKMSLLYFVLSVWKVRLGSFRLGSFRLRSFSPVINGRNLR